MVTRGNFSRIGGGGVGQTARTVKLTIFGKIFYTKTAYDVINFKFYESNCPFLPVRVHIVVTFDRTTVIKFRFIAKCYL